MTLQVIQVGYDPDPELDFAFEASDMDGIHAALTFESMCKWRFAFHMAQHYQQPDNVIAALGAWDERVADLTGCLVVENGVDPTRLKAWLACAREARDQRFYEWRDDEDGIERFEHYGTAKSLTSFLAYGG